LPVRNPDFSQSLELLLFTLGLRFYPNLQNNSVSAKFLWETMKKKKNFVGKKLLQIVPSYFLIITKQKCSKCPKNWISQCLYINQVGFKAKSS
jgi:hypothetical protein